MSLKSIDLVDSADSTNLTSSIVLILGWSTTCWTLETAPIVRVTRHISKANSVFIICWPIKLNTIKFIRAYSLTPTINYIISLVSNFLLTMNESVVLYKVEKVLYDCVGDEMIYIAVHFFFYIHKRQRYLLTREKGKSRKTNSYMFITRTEWRYRVELDELAMRIVSPSFASGKFYMLVCNL